MPEQVNRSPWAWPLDLAPLPTPPDHRLSPEQVSEMLRAARYRAMTRWPLASDVGILRRELSHLAQEWKLLYEKHQLLENQLIRLRAPNPPPGAP